MAPGGNRGWLLRLVIAFGFAQGAVSMARPAVSYRALALGADERAVGVIAGVYALLPLFAAVPLGRRTDHGRCAPLLPAGVVLISGGCALSGLAGSLWTMALWSGVMGLGHLCFVIGAQSLVARQSAPHEQDRNFGHFTIGASLGQLVGPVAAGALIGADMARTSALALLVAGAGGAVALTSLWRTERPGDLRSRTERGARVPYGASCAPVAYPRASSSAWPCCPRPTSSPPTSRWSASTGASTRPSSACCSASARRPRSPAGWSSPRCCGCSAVPCC
jgi:MFS family permease